MQTSATKSDGRWITRSISGQSAKKNYLCPGCQHQILPGTPHIVVWPHDPPQWSSSGVEFRRHWHNSCWARKK